MKILLPLVVLCFGFQALAGTKVCEKMAVATANRMLSKSNADDCFMRFVQPGKANPNLINVGFQCDHTGNYLYQVLTAPHGSTQCSVVKVTVKDLGI